ncbi:MAG TPA: APC family permease [Candidatus Angelobacter sp.]|jgi:amino acid transporter|nr:APC family permease [Candidatus Angelobacter sp.]
MNQLARKLRTVDYFTLGFGTMVGAGFLVAMDDWLNRGGPAGGILGFFAGGVILLPVAFIYGQLVMAIPDAGGEIAYTARVFPEKFSFIPGWMMILAYLVVCPWEAVAVGRILAYIFPQINVMELYQIGGQPVYLPHLVIGLGLTAIITFVNYRGIQISARFQNWTTLGLLILFAVFASCGLVKGKMANLIPAFSHSGFVSMLLVLQIVPYFMTGFESVAKSAEEANPQFRSHGYFRAILAAMLSGTAFYCVIIFVVAYAYPWKQSVEQHQQSPTAYALRNALGQPWIVNVILIAALLSLLKIFNGNFLATTRLVFAMGRRRMIHPRMAEIHDRNQTPSAAVLAIGLVTAVSVFLGSAILIPITEVGSLASACGWLSACVAYYFIQPAPWQRVIAAMGTVVSLGFIAMKVFPFVPGHFTLAEWIVLFLWIILGVLASFSGARQGALRAVEKSATE